MSDCPDCDKPKFRVIQNTKTSRKIKELLVNRVSFTESNLFAAKEPVALARDGSEVLPKLVLSSEALNTLYQNHEENLTLTVPGPNGDILKLLLVKNEIYTNEYKLASQKDKEKYPMSYAYFGVVEGHEGSRVVLNVFENEITGIITIDSDPLEISRDTSVRDVSEYNLVRASGSNKSFTCLTDCSNFVIPENEIQSRAVLSKFVRIYFDGIDNDTPDLITLFTAVYDIYINDPDIELQLQLAGINSTWTAGTVPFTYTNPPVSSANLNNYTAYRNSNPVTGMGQIDLYHLLPTATGQPTGTVGLANLDVLCANNNTGMSYLEPGPTTGGRSYTYNSNVVAHEIGHNLGSPHTFSCVWTGPTGATSQSIGGCGVTGETCYPCSDLFSPGTCLDNQPGAAGYFYNSNGVTWFSGLTVMGYCNDFEPQVFGPQPGALIVSRVTAANCLLCVHPDTLIFMADGTFKKIKDIKRGDWVYADKEGKKKFQVAKVSISLYNPNREMELVVFEKGSLGINTPSEKLIVTGAHPIFHKGLKYSARKFKDISGVTYYEKIQGKELLDITEKGCVEVYDLQFDDEGSYVAAGVMVESRSPWSALTPLDKELYFNKDNYTEERTYDSLKNKDVRSWNEVKEEEKWTLSNVQKRINEII